MTVWINKVRTWKLKVNMEKRKLKFYLKDKSTNHNQNRKRNPKLGEKGQKGGNQIKLD